MPTAFENTMLAKMSNLTKTLLCEIDKRAPWEIDRSGCTDYAQNTGIKSRGGGSYLKIRLKMEIIP